MRTVFESFLTTSKILFGFTWMPLLIFLPYIFLKPGKAITAVLLWVATLSISFLAMSLPPVGYDYRYWFVAVILFSFMTCLSVSLIKNPLLKTLFTILIVILFLNNSLRINKDFKAASKNDAFNAKRISEYIIDRRYSDSLILSPDGYVPPWYIPFLSKAYKKILHIESFPMIYPIELLAFYPEIIRDFKNIYEIREEGIIDITNLIEERIKSFKAATSKEKPEVKLIKDNKKQK